MQSELTRRIANLRDTDPKIRQSSARAISAMRIDCSAAIPALMKMVQGGDSNDRMAAMEALLTVGTESPEAADAARHICEQPADGRLHELSIGLLAHSEGLREDDFRLALAAVASGHIPEPSCAALLDRLIDSFGVPNPYVTGLLGLLGKRRHVSIRAVALKGVRAAADQHERDGSCLPILSDPNEPDVLRDMAAEIFVAGRQETKPIAELLNRVDDRRTVLAIAKRLPQTSDKGRSCLSALVRHFPSIGRDAFDRLMVPFLLLELEGFAAVRQAYQDRRIGPADFAWACAAFGPAAHSDLAAIMQDAVKRRRSSELADVLRAMGGISPLPVEVVREMIPLAWSTGKRVREAALAALAAQPDELLPTAKEIFRRAIDLEPEN